MRISRFPIRRFLLALGGVIIVACSTKADAQTPTPISSCGNVSGSVIISANLSTGNAVCLTVTANGTTINGNGKTISAASDAVSVTSKSNVTISNIISSKGVYIGGTSSFVTLQNSTVSSVGIFDADDITIDTVTMGSVAVQGSTGNPSLRTTFTNNTVTGNSSVLADFMGSDVAPCPRTDYVVTNNTFTSSYVCPGGVCDEPKTLFMRCGTHNTVTGNTVRSTGDAMGARFRDEFDNSTVANNTFWVNTAEGAFTAFNITAGNADKHQPRNNVFDHNLIRGDNDGGLYLQVSGSNNTFSYNTIWSNDNYVGNTVSDGPNSNTFNHNTFYNGGTGRMIYFTYRNAGTDVWTNNIFSYAGSETFYFDGWSWTAYSGNRNIFYARNGTGAFTPNGANLTAWKANASPDDANSLSSNPLFTNPVAGDFSLGSGSPARLAASDGTAIGAWQPGASCTESWSCGTWSTCANNSQSRTCTDANSCGTTTNRPALTQSCDSTAPTISITAPANGSTTSANTTITATASDNIGVVGVQFKIDGVNFGAEDTSAPYTITWNTSAVAPGTHSITAVARDAAGLSTTSAAVSVTVPTPVGNCAESWICDAWTVCTNNTQTRSCYDENGCGTTTGRPPLSQSCTSVDTTPPSGISDLR